MSFSRTTRCRPHLTCSSTTELQRLTDHSSCNVRAQVHNSYSQASTRTLSFPSYGTSSTSLCQESLATQRVTTTQLLIKIASQSLTLVSKLPGEIHKRIEDSADDNVPELVADELHEFGEHTFYNIYHKLSIGGDFYKVVLQVIDKHLPLVEDCLAPSRLKTFEAMNEVRYPNK